MNIQSLYLLIERIVSKNGHINNKANLIKKILKNDLSKYIGWEIPKIINLNKILKLPYEYGNVVALSFVHKDGESNLKTPIFAGLLVNQLINKKDINLSKILVDAGGMNTYFAISELSRRLKCKGIVITSRYYPQSFFAPNERSEIEVIRAKPNNKLSIEEEFYIDFVERMTSLKFREDKIPLWHVKNSHMIAEILSEEIKEKYIHKLGNIDHIITAVGSGATLALSSNLASSIKGCSILVAEHEKSILFGKKIKTFKNDDFEIDRYCKYEFYNTKKIPKIPQMILGPHYEKINNRIPQKYINDISHVITYSDEQWMGYSKKMEEFGFPVGNSTAANIAAAVAMSKKKKNVLTFIYEPLRKYTRVS